MNQKSVWNTIAKPWSKYRKYPVKEVLNFLKDKKGKILDLGCGSGRNFFSQEGLEFYGVDFSEKMLKFAEERAKELGIRVRLKQSNIEKLDFDDEFFDYSIFISTLHCIEGEKIRLKALQELYRVLKSGGEAIITVWDNNSNKKVSELKAKEGFINWQKDGQNHQRYYYFYDKKELQDFLKSVGFKIISSELAKADSKHAKKNIVVKVGK